MPGDAIVNPEDLARFARELDQFNRELHDSLSRLHNAFGRVSPTWRDQQQQRFSQEFDQMTRFLLSFDRSANEHIPLLLKKAGKAEEYLRQR